MRQAVNYITRYHAIFHSPPASLHQAAMKFVPHNIAAFGFEAKATHRSHKISTAENSKGHVNGALCLFLFCGTTLDSFLLAAASCLSGAMPHYVYGLDQRRNFILR